MIVIHFKSFSYHTNSIESFFPTESEKYRVLFTKILDCWNKKDISYKHDSAALLNNIFSELYKDNKKAYEYNSKIDLSIKYIEENCLKKSFSLQTAAEKSYISETHFRRLFKEEFGISPKQYVINLRIKRATSLIIAGYHTLKDISAMCGYEDYKHFSVEFKKITGISPSKYRYTKKELFLS